MAIRVSKPCSPASVGVVGKYKGDSSNKTAREESMHSLFFLFHPYKPFGILQTSWISGFASWTDGSTSWACRCCSLPRKSGVQQQAVLLGRSKVLSFHSWFSLQCPRSTYRCLYQPGLAALKIPDFGDKAFAFPTSLLLGNAEQLSHPSCV